MAEAATAELVLAPRNVTLHCCEHVHALYMPHAQRPYKLLSYMGRETRFHSYETKGALRYVAIMRRILVCDCMRKWAMVSP